MTTPRRALGFTGRIAVVALYGIVAFLVAGRFAENTTRPTPADPKVGEPSGMETSHLNIDVIASRPVTAWGMRLEGVPLAPRATSDLSWSGDYAGPLTGDSRLVLDIEPTPAVDPIPIAVRLRIRGENAQIDRTFWSDSDLVEAISLEQFCAPEGNNP
ncbi:MAG: hypothetical protein R3F07_18320 [Opitutaceae bacterium]